MEFWEGVLIGRDDSNGQTPFADICGAFKRAVEQRLRQLRRPRNAAALSEAAELHVLSLHLTLLLVGLSADICRARHDVVEGIQKRFVEEVLRLYG